MCLVGNNRENVADSFETVWFNVTRDHFRFSLDANGEIPTFPLKTLIMDKHWTGEGQLSNGCKGPILFYTGNEGPIEGRLALYAFIYIWMSECVCE
jgi:hypothetical protein